MPQPGYARNLLNQLLRGRHSAKPAVHAANIAQRGLNILRRTRVGIEKLGCVEALHRGTGIGQSGNLLASQGGTLWANHGKKYCRGTQTSASSSSSNCLLYRSV